MFHTLWLAVISKLSQTFNVDAYGIEYEVDAAKSIKQISQMERLPSRTKKLSAVPACWKPDPTPSIYYLEPLEA